MINSFKGKYYFLSNFYEAPVTYDGITYQNNEAAFQAQKTLCNNEKIEFSKLNPSEAKRKGRKVTLRPDWEQIKETRMLEICKAKFNQNSDLCDMLIATGNTHLEEGNTWGDKVWGTVDGIGQNRLGKILMDVRYNSKIKGEKEDEK